MSQYQLDKCIRLSWYKPTDKGIRYYTAQLHQDLWGNWIVTRTWGRKGTHLGRSMNVLCESYEDGLEQLETVKSRRKQHGYDPDYKF